MDQKVLGICGAGGLGREVLELSHRINNYNKRWDSFVFIEVNTSIELVHNTRVFTYEDAKSEFGKSLEAVIAVGEPKIRKKIYGELKEDGIEMPRLIYPDVYIPETTEVGEGVVIQSGCFVSCDTRIGAYSHLQPACYVGHDSVIEEGCMINSLCSIAGAVHIGENTFMGMNSSVREGVSIGAWSIIGMGSVVCNDVSEETVAAGNPARPMRRNEEKRVFKHRQ